MTLNEMITAARNRYNAYGSSFWGDDELRQLIYEACMALSVEGEIIEKSFEAQTVDGTQEYELPQYTIGVKRAVWYGKPLEKISFIDEDQINGWNEMTITRGDPVYFNVWENKIRLLPTPSSARTLKVYTYNEPQPLVQASILEIPSRFHIYMLDYVLAMMVLKDDKFALSDKLLQRWENQILKVRVANKKLKRSGAFNFVRPVEKTVNER